MSKQCIRVGFTSVYYCLFVSVDLEHDWTLLLHIDGDVGTCHPRVGAQVPQSHIGVSDEEVKRTIYISCDFQRAAAVETCHFGPSISCKAC